jgi:hypothetical protein
MQFPSSRDYAQAQAQEVARLHRWAQQREEGARKLQPEPEPEPEPEVEPKMLGSWIQAATSGRYVCMTCINPISVWPLSQFN